MPGFWSPPKCPSYYVVWLVAGWLCCHVVACVYYDDLANTTQARFAAISTIANSW